MYCDLVVMLVYLFQENKSYGDKPFAFILRCTSSPCLAQYNCTNAAPCLCPSLYHVIGDSVVHCILKWRAEISLFSLIGFFWNGSYSVVLRGLILSSFFPFDMIHCLVVHLIVFFKIWVHNFRGDIHIIWYLDSYTYINAVICVDFRCLVK